MKSVCVYLCLLLMVPLAACQAQPLPDTESDYYSTGPRSRDGIGKYYLGREIAQVMGHLGASWLERPEREREERTDLLIKNLELNATDVVADIGAGSGYFTFRMAPLVPEGKVLAVDIQQEMLDIMQQKMKASSLNNIEFILGDTKSPKLPPASVDVVIFVDVYHELSHPREMFKVIVDALKPGGRVVLVEYRMEDDSVPIKRLHKMSVKQAKIEMKAVGLRLKQNLSNLPWQHQMVFVREK